MKSFIDSRMVNRRASLAHTASLGGLLVLLASVALSMLKPNLAVLASVLLFLGFAVSVVGIFMANRWVRKPRPEMVLDEALKSLSDQHRLYHYVEFCDHLLLTPAGLVVLEAVNLDGGFTYKDGKWKQKIGFSRAIRYVFEPRLGDPIEQACRTAQTLKDKFSSQIEGMKPVPVDSLVVFTHPAAEVEVKGNPIPVTVPKKLTKLVMRNQNRLPVELYRQIRDFLDGLVGEDRDHPPY